MKATIPQCLRQKKKGAAEMPRELRAHIALAEGPASAPRTHMGCFTTACDSSFTATDTPAWPLWAHIHTHAYTQKCFIDLYWIKRLNIAKTKINKQRKNSEPKKANKYEPRHREDSN